MLVPCEKYRLLFELAPIGISIVDSDRNIIEANAALEETVRMASADLKKGLFHKRKYLDSSFNEIPWDNFPSSIALREKRIVRNVEVGIIDEASELSWALVSAAPLVSDETLAVVITEDINDFKKIQKEYIYSESKFKSIYENCLEAILLTSPDGTIYNANPAACKMFGRSEDEICGLGRDFFVDTGDPNLSELLKERDVKGYFSGELTLVRKNGERFPAELSSSIFTSPEGHLRTSMIIRDITARKTSDMALLESEERLRLASEATGFGFYSYDFITNKTFYSKELLSLYGLAPDQKINLYKDFVPENIHPDDRDKFLSAIQMSINPKKSGFMDIELRILLSGKKFRWLRIRNYTSFTGRKATDRPLLSYGIVQDVTSQKKARIKLAESELKYSIIADNTADWEFWISEKKKYIYHSPSCKRITGYLPKDLMGDHQKIEKLIHPHDLDMFRKHLRESFQNLRISTIEFRIIDKKGAIRWIEQLITPVFNKDGIFIGLRGSNRDCTQRLKDLKKLKDSERKLRKLTIHIEEVRENEQRKLAMDLHDDLGQRLTAINIDIAWLKSRIGVQSQPVVLKLEEMSHLINESIQRIKEVSADLSPSILFDLGVVPAFQWMLKNFQDQSGIIYSFNHDNNEFMIDSKLSLVLYRILQESLTNIVRHSNASKIKISLHLTKNIIELIINDNGIGIDEEKLNSFNSLGIIGIKERVRAVNGRVSIKGVKGIGTTIIIDIPLK